jgi:diaminopimelate epimerase
VIPGGRSFYKMSGSGNDFVMIDARVAGRGRLDQPDVVRAVCTRGTGVGADGIVFLEASKGADIRLTYLNADGSRADFCGNATLCTTRLATELGVGGTDGLSIETDSGLVAARIREGRPEIDLQPVTDVRPEVPGIDLKTGEQRIGYAVVGVPHLVILCADVWTVDVVGRGRPLRSHPSLSHGANVNFISRTAEGDWRYRTYERGVEAETLACGSGAVATGILLSSWGLAEPPVEIRSRSGRTLAVNFERSGGSWSPSLSGEGRVVYRGELSEI